MDEYMSVEFADEVRVGAEEVCLSYGGDLGLRQHQDDVVAGKPRVLEFRHFFFFSENLLPRTNCLRFERRRLHLYKTIER